jgi:hypothetical protein
MGPRPRRKKSGSRKASPARAEPATLPSEASGLRPRLQILAGFLLPLVVLGVWLNSRGFFGSP